MWPFIIGATSALFGGALGILNCIKGLSDPGRRQRTIAWVQITLISSVSVLAVAMLYHQDRSAAKSAGRLSQMREDLDKTLALMYKQEVVRSISIEIEPHGCLLRPIPRQGAEVPLWATDLRTVVSRVIGREPRSSETAALQFMLSYGQIWIVLSGQAHADKERWMYSLGTISPPIRSPLVGLPVPLAPNQEWHSKLLAVELNDSHIRPFIPNPPTIADVVMAQPFMTDVFDPRTEMGLAKITHFGLYSGPLTPGEAPDISRKDLWHTINVPFDYFRCWDIRLAFNGRRVENIMNPDGGQPPLGERVSHWPGRIIGPELREGMVWLAPWPEDWRELRSFMNCRVDWLVYAETPQPCPNRRPRPQTGPRLR